MNSKLYDNWAVQYRKGVLELCILSAISGRKEMYGLAIIEQLKNAKLDINEGTLYPLLNRMHANGLLNSNWKTKTQSGHPRRFYSLSKAGRENLPLMLENHQNYIKSLKFLETNHG